MLRWAIRRAGYGVEEFLSKDERCREWLSGSRTPTYPQLRDFARKLHVNPLVLLEDSPPDESLPMTYFRAGRASTSAPSLNVYDAIQILRSRQDWLSEYMQQELDFAPLPFVGCFSTPEEVINSIRKTLQIPPGWQRERQNPSKALQFLVQQCELQHIFVSSNGVVGNNTSRAISPEECRGFALSDPYAPFIFLNARDATVANLFTLAHELAHIWLGSSAIHDGTMVAHSPSDDATERHCDQVAAELLMPAQLVGERLARGDNLEKIAIDFRVSRIAMARRAFELGYIGRGDMDVYYRDYREQSRPKSGGGDFYLTATKRLGKSFSRFVDSAVRNNYLSHRDAYRLTGLRGSTYDAYIKSWRHEQFMGYSMLLSSWAHGQTVSCE